MNLDPSETALLVVDMQNDFCHPDGALYAEESEAVLDPINALLDRAREAGTEVVYTQDTHTDDQFEDAHYYDEYDQWGEHVGVGSWGWELHDDLNTDSGEVSVMKPTYDAFYDTDFDLHMRERGINDLVIVGTLANVCVLHTAASAGLRDYRPILVRDCVGYIEEAHRDYALDHADFLFGEVVTRDQLSFEANE